MSPTSGTEKRDKSNRPLACWYVPKYRPKQLKQQYQELLNLPAFSGKGEAATAFKHTYIDGHPYKNFNMAKQGKGYRGGLRHNNAGFRAGSADCRATALTAGHAPPGRADRPRPLARQLSRSYGLPLGC